MTGWRCGWALGPAEVIAACNALQSHSTSNVTSISQKAAFAALTGPQDPSTAMLAEYRKRRDSLHAWLTADPRIKCVKPAGAFYLFIDISALLSPDGIRTSAEFAERAAARGARRADRRRRLRAPGFLRISYATSMEQLREGATRIQHFIEKLEHEGKLPAVDRAAPDGIDGGSVRASASRSPDSRSRASPARGIVGDCRRECVRRRAATLLAYGTDALKQGHPADLVVLPARHAARSPRSRGSATTCACRSSSAAPARVIQAAPCRSRAASSSASSG